jgi:hypothetical protein
MALFGRTALEPDTNAALTELVGRRPRILASGRGVEGEVVGLIDRLVYRTEGQWHQQLWHEVERGNWDLATRRLRWTDIHGAASELELTETGMLPDLFNERVTASIACLQVVELRTRGNAMITARRDLGDAAAPLVWRISPGKGVNPEAVAGDPIVASELVRLRAEYDVG